MRAIYRRLEDRHHLFSTTGRTEREGREGGKEMGTEEGTEMQKEGGKREEERWGEIEGD